MSFSDRSDISNAADVRCDFSRHEVEGGAQQPHPLVHRHVDDRGQVPEDVGLPHRIAQALVQRLRLLQMGPCLPR